MDALAGEPELANQREVSLGCLEHPDPQSLHGRREHVSQSLRTGILEYEARHYRHGGHLPRGEAGRGSRADLQADVQPYAGAVQRGDVRCLPSLRELGL